MGFAINEISFLIKRNTKILTMFSRVCKLKDFKVNDEKIQRNFNGIINVIKFIMNWTSVFKRLCFGENVWQKDLKIIRKNRKS